MTLMAGGLVITGSSAWWSYRQTSQLIAGQIESEIRNLAHLRSEREGHFFSEAERIVHHITQLMSSTQAQEPISLVKTTDGNWRESIESRKGLPLVAFAAGEQTPPPELQSAWNLLAAHYENNSELFQSLTVVDPGRWLVSCGTRAPELADSLLPKDPLLLPNEQEMFRISGDQPRWSACLFEPATNALQTTLMRPVNTGGRRLACMLQIPIEQIVSRVTKDRTNGQTIILDSEGYLIDHPQLRDAIQEAQGKINGRLFLRDEEFQFLSSCLRLEGPDGLITSPDGSMAGVTHLPAAGISLVTIFSAEMLRGPAVSAAFESGIVAIISTTILAALVHLTLRHHVTKPLRKFIYAAEQLASGKRGISLNPERSDEIGELARAMIRMDCAISTAENDLKQLNASLELRVEERTLDLKQVNQELESFSYSVSHDLRAPLRRIDGFSQILLEDYSDKIDADGQRYLQTVRNQTQQMGNLISDLLGLARVGRATIQRQTVDLSTICTEIIKSYRDAEPERKCTCDIENGLIVIGDPGLLKIVCDNLLGNAWKYSAKVDQPIIYVKRSLINGINCIIFGDNGAGFDRARATRLFAPFQRFHHQDDFSGTGIGLATVQRIVTRHGGIITAESEPGKGATFTVSLPTPDQPRISNLTASRA